MFSNLSFNIKFKALELGFQKIGITQAVSTPIEKANLDTWLQKGHHGSMEWIVKRKNERGDISGGRYDILGHHQFDLKFKF